MRLVVFLVALGCVGRIGAEETLPPPAPPLPTDTSPRNILWDGKFLTGFGNAFWTTTMGNQGPSRRDSWSEQGMNLQMDVCSRVYPLDEGSYALGAWVKRNPAAPSAPSVIILELTNLNYYGDATGDSFVKKIVVPAGPSDDWQRVGWSFAIKAPVRRYFHVELRGGAGLLVREASLTAGDELPDTVRPAADVEAGFDIPEETRVYVDGEERVVDLVASSIAGPRKAKVRWAIYNHREELVKDGVVELDFPAGPTTRRVRLPLADLPHGGYRFASSVDGQPVLGDALLALLPKIDPRLPPYLGADANIEMRSMAYTHRMMERLGMKTVNALSTSGNLGRWNIVQADKDKLVWRDEPVKAAHDAGLDVMLEPMMFKSIPKWVQAQFMKNGEITDEAGFTEAATTYLRAMILHYGTNMAGVILDDEVNTFATPARLDQVRRIYSALHATAKQAASEIGRPGMPIGINATSPGWWISFLDKLPSAEAEVVSSNTNTGPESAAVALNALRKMNVFPAEYRTIGVGQRSRMRATSLFLDRPAGGGAEPGLFAWQLLVHAWLNRPHGTDDPKDGPLVHYGYYDLRTLAQAAYMPSAGKSGIEYDNSPTLGMQAMAMLKYQLQGMRPARDAGKPFSSRGEVTGHERLFAYPFRDAGRAVIVLATGDARDLDATWKLAGVDFKRWKPSDLYAQPLPLDRDGAIEVKDLPLFLRLGAADLDTALKDLGRLRAELPQKTDQHRLTVGDFTLEIDPTREGYFTLLRAMGDRKVVILDRLTGLPALPKPITVTVMDGRTSGSAVLMFGKGDPDHLPRLSFNLTAESCQISWRHDNVVGTEAQQVLRLRLGTDGGGKEIVIQEDGRVRAGRLREDYGEFFPSATPPPAVSLPAGNSRVELKGFATFDLSGATGVGFSPATGFLWQTQDGEAFLQADYRIAPYTGGGSRGIQKIQLQVVIK